MTDLGSLLVRRAALEREIAVIDETLGKELEALASARHGAEKPDEALTLTQAAALLGEPPETFRRRLEYRKARISRPGEHRLRYSRVELERIKADRLKASEEAR